MEEISEQYTKIKQLGVKPLMKTYLVKIEQLENQFAVIQEFEVGKIDTEQGKKAIFDEFKILEELKHVNIINVRNTLRFQNKLELVTDYVENKSLQKMIYNQKNLKKDGKQAFFSKNQVLQYFAQICLAVKYCHDRKIAHGMINSQNILIDHDGTIKLVNFKNKKFLDLQTQYKFQKLEDLCNVQPPPEEFQGLIEQTSYKQDIWALGIVLYQMCTLKLPFKGKNPSEIIQSIIQGNEPDPIPEHFGKNIEKLIKAMLRSDPKKRVNIYQICEVQCVQKRIKQRFSCEQEFLNEFSKSYETKTIEIVDIDSQGSTAGSGLSE